MTMRVLNVIFAFEEREVCGALGVFDWEFGITVWNFGIHILFYGGVV